MFEMFTQKKVMLKIIANAFICSAYTLCYQYLKSTYQIKPSNDQVLLINSQLVLSAFAAVISLVRRRDTYLCNIKFLINNKLNIIKENKCMYQSHPKLQ